MEIDVAPLQQEDTGIPRLSVDLIQFLDETEPAPDIRYYTKTDWSKLDQAQVRLLAYQAGRRSLVDMLKNWVEEEEADVEDRNARLNEPRNPGELLGVY